MVTGPAVGTEQGNTGPSFAKDFWGHSEGLETVRVLELGAPSGALGAHRSRQSLPAPLSFPGLGNDKHAEHGVIKHPVLAH